MKKTGLFFDIDGTLRDMRTGIIPKSTKPTLEGLKRAGYFIAIATGRSTGEVDDDIRTLIDWDAMVCNNGQMAYDREGTVLFEKIIPSHIIEFCLAQAEREGRPLQFMTAEGEVFLNIPADSEVRKSYELFGLEPPKVRSYCGERIVALMAFGPEGGDYSAYTSIGGISAYPGAGPYADIALEGTSKRSGIESVMERYGLERCIAFGDSLNDIEMLKGADIAVVMGNGHPDVVKLADLLTDSVLEDGIARACKKLGLYPAS